MTLLVLTIGSLLLAVAMTGVAWRVSREEHRRAQARIAALAAEIHQSSKSEVSSLSDQTSEFQHESSKSEVRSLPDQTSDFQLQTSPRDLFVRSPPKSARRFGTVVAAGVFVCATVGAFAVISSRSPQSVAAPSNPANVANAANPLELLALGHDRDGDRLTVRGVVRNPNRAGLDHVTAIVLLFGHDGAFLTSGRADVASTILGPGAETTFVVTVPGAADVGRYRVSFRTEDRVVPHVDRRSST